MAYGDGDAEESADEPAGRKPLPPPDRVWRHPAEVARDERRRAAVVRARRRRATVTVLGGFAAAAGLLWLARSGPTDVAVRADLVSLGGSDDEVRTTTAEATTTIADPAARAIPTSAPSSDPSPSDAPPTSSQQDPVPSDPLPSSSLQSDPPPSDPLPTDPPSSDALRIGDGDGDGPETLAGALRMRDGYLITSGRALNGAETVTVSWGDHTATGTVIGYDSVADVAVISVDADTPGAEFVDASPVVAGDLVLLIDPESDDDAKRVIDEMSTSKRIDGEPVVGIVELDGTLGAVPPGSPAFDTSGALVGVVAETAADAPAAIVPIDFVRAVAEQIISYGAATHPRLGVRARNPVPDAPPGSLVTRVTADGPAEAGGIEVGDLIVEIADTPIDSMESMVATLRSHEPGDAVVVEVIRDGKRVGCPVELDSAVDTAT